MRFFKSAANTPYLNAITVHLPGLIEPWSSCADLPTYLMIRGITEYHPTDMIGVELDTGGVTA